MTDDFTPRQLTVIKRYLESIAEYDDSVERIGDDWFHVEVTKLEENDEGTLVPQEELDG